MKIALKILAVLIGTLLILAFIFRAKIYRLQFATKMFSGVEQVERFRSVETYFPTRVINPSGTPSTLKQIPNITLPEEYTYQGKVLNREKFFEETDVTGFLVMRNDTILFEDYYQGNTAESHTIAWSVTKSFVSALMGIAISEGHVKSINDVASDYLPELKGSAYEQITIKNLLQMSSGVSWNEDYNDKNSDINRYGRMLALGGSFEAFVKTLTTDKKQGTYNRYNSSDTQVLGMIISRATKRNLSQYLEEKLWQPLGMENKAWWVVDDQGNEFAAGGLNASLRDYARLGQLYLNKGKWNGQQIVPAEWVAQSLTPDAPHLMAGVQNNSNNPLGYGFQWWILEGDEGEFMARGVYNQQIYVNPTHNIVIAKSSANNMYGTTKDESTYRRVEAVELVRAIVKEIKE